jgi:murein DD-endopeptidase MepM/ murein hydrolase activator NlpD
LETALSFSPHSSRGRLLLRLCGVLVVVGAVVSTGSSPASAQDSSGDGVPGEVGIHVVQAGESLDSIAADYGVSAEMVRLVNNINVLNDPEVGQRLVIPTGGSTSKSLQVHPIVAEIGDSVETLAKRHGGSSMTLAQLNGIVAPGHLVVGQTLQVTSAAGAPEESMGLIRLGKDDSILRAALRENANLSALLQLNGLLSPFPALPGQLIGVPDSQEPDRVLFDPWVSINLHPAPLEPGRSGGVVVETAGPGTLTGSFGPNALTFVSDESGTTHQAVFGVDRWTEPGIYLLALQFQDANGRSWVMARDVVVESGNYGSEVIRLAPDTAALLTDEQSIAEENFYIQSSMSGFSPEKSWDGLFLLPATGVMTSAYGTARTYSGGPQLYAFHSGTDFAGPVGTPVVAPADGVVVDSGVLNIRGFVTIIDHGRGVYTGYWHQSSILVNPGDVVTAGQQIGTIGNTGLSTAAHLHWEMWVGGVQVDPLQWVREEFP